ncbi:MAG: selenocysteine-specific translation elongation factor [Phycisphaerales bacterium]|nr:selenocysteine-specific translation elongation factor [Phycisphaerales bacterium]
MSTTPTHHLILGTAGHIDHGKTSLVRALTGVDTDRLPEEKRRGLTIELGFAELALDGVTFGVVDVPGHERFVRTMVAGATGIDVALLVVAADDSIMPQTVEHVEILDLLGVRSGVVAVTKCDLVDDELAELVAVETAELLAHTRLADAPIVRVSATTGAGLDTLRHELCIAARAVERRRLDHPFRLSIDRAFSVPGRGTVVTGSVHSGQLSAGDPVEVWPGGHAARAREVQTHHRGADRVEAGQRAAINLQGLDLRDVDRGSELAAPGTLTPTRWLDVELHCLASHPHALRAHARLRLCLGTRELLVRCVLLDPTELLPGQRALAQLRCREELVASYGQRFIVRDENAARTAGGGTVLRAARRRISPRMTDDVAGLNTLRDAAPVDRLEETLRYLGSAAPDPATLALAAHVDQAALPDLTAQLLDAGRLIALPGLSQPVSVRWLERIQRRAAAWVAARHQQHPDEPGTLLDACLGFLERRSHRAAARPILDRMRAAGTVRIVGRYVCLAEFAPSLSHEDERVLAAVLSACADAAFQPPSVEELAARVGAKRPRVEKVVKIATAVGQLVRIDAATVLHADREAEMRTRTQALFDASGPFTLSQLRETLDTSRKYAVPFAEYLDRIGFTRRQGDQRVVVPQEKP